MSEKALALVFINLGGEMLYVLDQRLYAQKIQVDKGKKIMQDIVSNMFSERFLEEIFRSQELCSRKALRTIFERLAHTSIMRLNDSSMDKLFDLMTMAVKYQITLASKPKEILLVTLNHLDNILPFVSDSNTCVQLIEQCYKRLFKVYLNLNDSELQLIRYTMLNFFQDLKIKVSVFLKEKVQNWNGTFILFHEGPVAPGFNIPGSIAYYDENGSIYKQSKFNPGATYTDSVIEGSYDRNGDRVIKLGLNVYSSNKQVDTIVPTERGVQKSSHIVSDYEANIPDPKAKAQLDLLCKLIGKSSSSENNNFKLNLFNNEEEEFIYSTQMKAGGNYEDDYDEKRVLFDSTKRNRDERLNKVMTQFSSSSSSTRSKYDDDDGYSSSRSKRDQHTKSKSKPNSKSYNYEDEDDDDDVVAMMDRMNRPTK